MAQKSILNESKEIERAVTLIDLGARLQVLESETSLSYERLLRLYKEVAGRSPSKGQLPFSTDWFLTWQENIHSSLFLNISEYLSKSSAGDDIDMMIKAYRLYDEQVKAIEMEPLLSFTRGWRTSSPNPPRTRATTTADCATRRRAPARARPQGACDCTDPRSRAGTMGP